MEDCFDKLVVIEDRRRVGSQRNVGSVREAAECLIGIHWPRPHGARHRAAERACLRAHAGENVTSGANLRISRGADSSAGTALGYAGSPP